MEEKYKVWGIYEAGVCVQVFKYYFKAELVLS